LFKKGFFMETKEIYESRMFEAFQHSEKVGMQKYAKWLERAKHMYREAYGYEMPRLTTHNLVTAYQSMEEDYTKLFGSDKVRKAIYETADSTTTPTDINKFINHAFEMVTAMMPVTIMEKFTSVQNIDRRVAEIFYMDIMRGNSKGLNNDAGSVYMGALSASKDTGDSYSSSEVPFEKVYTGDGSTLSFTSGSLQWTPIIAGSVTLTYTVGATEYTVTDVNGTFTDSTNLTSGSVSLTNGALSLVFKGGKAPADETDITASYEYDPLIAGGEVPEVTARLRSVTVSAKRRALNAKYLFDASLLLGKEHGIDMEQELLEKATAGMMNEIAVSAAKTLLAGATTSSDMNFNRIPPNEIIPRIQHTVELVGNLARGGLDIENEIRFATPSFILCGRDFSSIIKYMPENYFKPAVYTANKKPVGMHVVGMLDNQYEVIQNLDYAHDQFLLGALGDWMYAGSVYCEFIPLTVLNANWNTSMDIWRSCVQWSGFKVLNTNFYKKAVITEVTP
jgi:hypothetical protein